MEKQNIIDGIRLIVIIGVFIFMVIGSYRNIIKNIFELCNRFPIFAKRCLWRLSYIEVILNTEKL